MTSANFYSKKKSIKMSHSPGKGATANENDKKPWQLDRFNTDSSKGSASKSPIIDKAKVKMKILNLS